MSDLRVFKRYEKKYLLSKEQFSAFFTEYFDKLDPDEYPENLIQNIYYDTANFRLIRDSLDKPVYKEKLRLRCYNEIHHGEPAYLEIKKKYEGIVYKRREKIDVDKAEAFVRGEGMSPESQIGKELQYFARFYGDLRPAMYLSYYRTAWVLKDDRDLRITFDTDLTWRTSDVNLISGSYGNKLLPEGSVLMEIKCGEAYPMELVRLLEKYSIFPTSFSKYGLAYSKLLLSAAVGAAEAAMAYSKNNMVKYA